MTKNQFMVRLIDSSVATQIPDHCDRILFVIVLFVIV